MKDKTLKFVIAVIGVESCLVMAGWIFNIDALTRVIPFGINMKFATAFMFFLSAIALYHMSRAAERNDYDRPILILPAISLSIFVISSTLFAAGVFDIPTGIESLFILEAASVNALGSGLLSVPTLVNFMVFAFICVASLFAGFRRLRLRALAGAIIVAVGLLATAGYAFSFPPLYYSFNSSSTPMALNTALTFILLGSGLIIIGINRTIDEA